MLAILPGQEETPIPRIITDADSVQDYISGIMVRAAHRTSNEDEIGLSIAGAVVWRKDADLQVLDQDGEIKHVLWVPIDGHWFALARRYRWWTRLASCSVTGLPDVTHSMVRGAFG